jgi:rfaE bifunctional protein kinase chain/domain
MNNNFSYLIKKFIKKKIVVIGDIILDKYIYGETKRVSREAPVLILKYSHEGYSPGGCANATNNIKSLGGIPLCVGVVGKDKEGEKLLEIFQKEKINTSGIVIDKDVRTITKTRVMAGGFHTSRQQLLRIDEENEGNFSSSTRRKLLKMISKFLKIADGILFSDYGYGVVNDEMISYVIKFANKKGIPVIVDSRYNLLSYKNASIATPNELELISAYHLDSKKDYKEKEIIQFGKKLIDDLSLNGLIITRGRLGMFVLERNGNVKSIPIVGQDEVVDVSGAGDTVSSVVSLATSSNINLVNAAILATYAAGVVVTKRGTATVSQEELKSIFNTTKISISSYV